MLQWTMVLQLASGRTSPHADPLSIAFFLAFGLIGFVLFLNPAGTAEKTLALLSKLVLGCVGSASTRMVQGIGALIGVLSCVGLAVEGFVAFSG